MAAPAPEANADVKPEVKTEIATALKITLGADDVTVTKVVATKVSGRARRLASLASR
mgnify:CR=1 FL=1